jgi:tRNA dimethylallyltransferase
VVRPVIAVVGATATGKTDLALALAESLGGEIVNADAMQLYRGMDIGTAKTPPAERRGIPHHQIDVLDVTEEASVAAYQRACRADLAGIDARSARAVLVGGSGLYVRAALDDLSFPGTDAALRAALVARAEETGPGPLHAELARRDPAAAAAIDPGNTRRVVRALEVVTLTGAPFAARLPAETPLLPAVWLGLRLERPALDYRIADRARRMFADGLVEETRALMASQGQPSRTASRAVGYAQALAVLSGSLREEDAVEATILATRRLARRQEKWFRRDERIRWLDAGSGPEQTVRAALRTLLP